MINDIRITTAAIFTETAALIGVRIILAVILPWVSNIGITYGMAPTTMKQNRVP